jgi:hypothetical protein
VPERREAVSSKALKEYSDAPSKLLKPSMVGGDSQAAKSGNSENHLEASTVVRVPVNIVPTWFQNSLLVSKMSFVDGTPFDSHSRQCLFGCCLFYINISITD